MIEDVEHLLIEKPLALIYWDLEEDLSPVETFLTSQKGLEVKRINSLKELIYWFNIGEVSVIVLGTESLEKVKDFKLFLDNKLPVEKRRKIQIIYVTTGLKTLHPKEVFLLSANLIVSKEHLSEFPRAFEKALKYWEFLYKPFNKALQKVMEEEL